ncbi:MAG: hypothetical protein CMJ86_07390 [Planctomycetes bacterium]|nr:hypothetical protein [Planctomycetota bacterium]
MGRPQASRVEFQSVPHALASLEAPSRSLRTQAQDWLDEHLLPEHTPLLVEALSAGAETERRLALIIGGRDHHFALAVALLSSPLARGQALGREALIARYLDWNPEGSRLPQSWSAVRGRLSDPPGESVSIDLTGAHLVEVIDQLDRLGGAPLPLLVDPRWTNPLPIQHSSPGVLEGSWSLIFNRLARQYRGKLMLLPGTDAGQGSPGAGSMLLMVPLGVEFPSPSAEILVDWIKLVQRPHDRESNRRGAMALARSGWPGALVWLGERFAADASSPVLDALLDAAARGRWCGALDRREALLGVLAELEGGLEVESGAAWMRAGRLARALRALGSVTKEGSSLVPDLVAGLATAKEIGQWVRLEALAAMASPVGSSVEHPELIAAARAALARPGHPARRMAAMTWLNRLGAPALGPDAKTEPLADPWPLLEWGVHLPSAHFIPKALVRQGWRPPEESRPGPGTSSSAQILYMHWLLLGGEVERALKAAPEEDSALLEMVAMVLDDLRREDALEVRERFLQGLRDLGRGVAVGHLELHPGPGFNRPFAEQLLDSEASRRSPLDWSSIGMLAVRGPFQEQAQDLLVNALADPRLRVNALQPLQEVWAGMLGDREDKMADEFMGRVEEALGPQAFGPQSSIRDILEISRNKSVALGKRDVAWPRD